VPGTTHSNGRYFCRNIYQIARIFRRICFEDVYAGTPCFFLEPRFVNRKEYKVVIPYNDVSENGEGRAMEPFFAKNHIDSGPDFKAFAPNQNIMSFARRCKDIFERNATAAVCCPLLRVDIFESQCNMLYMNEMENLDALVQVAAQKDASYKKRPPKDTDVKMERFRERFFIDKLTLLIKLVNN
jgi:hypothetical protein